MWHVSSSYATMQFPTKTSGMILKEVISLTRDDLDVFVNDLLESANK